LISLSHAGFFLSAQYGISPLLHFFGPDFVSTTSFLSTPLSSISTLTSLTYSLAVDPSLHTLGGTLPVHAGLVVPSEHAGGVPVAAVSLQLIEQTSGLSPPAHVGNAPSEHLAGPTSLVVFVVALLGSEPSLQKLGFVIAEALPHIGGFESEHFLLLAS
jgi:hypothetical protein